MSIDHETPWSRWRSASTAFWGQLDAQSATAPGSAGGQHEEHWRAEGYLAGNVLAWRVGDVVFRLEADVTKQRALELARSLEES